MANPSKKNVNREAQRRQKEEQARRSRRLSRQVLGFALTVLIIVGVVSVVRAGIGFVRDVTDDASEKAEFEQRLTTMVWFDVPPFEAVSELDQNTVKQVAIWGIYARDRATLPTNQDGAVMVPVVDVDLYAAELFGPNFRFTEHAAFQDQGPQQLRYDFDEAQQMYVLPITALSNIYRPSVVDVKNERGGIKRVTVGYISTVMDPNALVPEYNNDIVMYRDFIFQRDGGRYYLVRLERNDTMVVPTTSSSVSVPPPLALSDSEAAVSVPQDAGSSSQSASSSVDEEE